MARLIKIYPGSWRKPKQKQSSAFLRRKVQKYFCPVNCEFLRSQGYTLIADVIHPVEQRCFQFQKQSHCPHLH